MNGLRLELRGFVIELVHDFKRLYPGSAEEPPDYEVKSRLYVNGAPVNPLRYPRIMRRLERQGRSF